MSEIKPVAQVGFELRTNVLKGQWESDELNDTDFFRAMCREYEDYIPALQARITELEYQLANYKAAADGTTHWCAECKMRNDKIMLLEAKNDDLQQAVNGIWLPEHVEKLHMEILILKKALNKACNTLFEGCCKGCPPIYATCPHDKPTNPDCVNCWHNWLLEKQ